MCAGSVPTNGATGATVTTVWSSTTSTSATPSGSPWGPSCCRAATTVQGTAAARVQTLVYHILPPPIAVTDHAKGLESLSALANGLFSVAASNVSEFVTDDSNYIRRFFFNRPSCLHQQSQNSLNRDGTGFQARSRGGRWSWTLKLAQKRS